MKIAGIIVEYNPLHNGHVYHINETLKKSDADLLIAVMSGNVVQRGEFSSFDKFSKTKWALNAGIDLVIELPGLYVLQNADIFAATAVDILHKAGVHEIYFGSEKGDINALKSAAEIMRTDVYDQAIKKYLDQGYSYPSSADKAMQSLSSDTVHKNPNDILGIQYINAAYHLKTPIKMHAIKRTQSGYYESFDKEKTIQSATAIRARLSENKLIENTVPPYVLSDRSKFFDHKTIFPYLKFLLSTYKKETLKTIFSVEEGIETHILKAFDAKSYGDLIKQLSTKRYTQAKIKRLLMHMILGVKKSDLTTFDIPYLRILGMNKKGQAHLNQLKHTLDIPLITKIKRTRHPLLETELQISKLYSFFTHEDNYLNEFLPVIIL